MYCHLRDRIRFSLSQQQRSLAVKEINHVVACSVCTEMVEGMCQDADEETQRKIVSAFSGYVNLCKYGRIHPTAEKCNCVTQDKMKIIELRTQAQLWIGTLEDDCPPGMTRNMVSNPQCKEFAIEVLTEAIAGHEIELRLARAKAELLGIAERFPVFTDDEYPVDSQLLV